jgi:hypothetical protein
MYSPLGHASRPAPCSPHVHNMTELQDKTGKFARCIVNKLLQQAPTGKGGHNSRPR